ncbi:Chitinase class I [Cronobacter sakazakii]|nr:Chitinase class I [Cronobacter sakazakii]
MEIAKIAAIGAAGVLAGAQALAAPLLSSSTPYTLNASDLTKKEQELTNFPLMQSVKSAIRTLDNAQVEQIAPGRAANPDNVKRVEKILSAQDWEYLFPLRAPEYTYINFLKAVGKFPAVCGSYSDGRDADAICRKSLATMFAHFAQETGGHESWREQPEWRQALVYLREMGWSEGQKGGYNGECNPDTWQGQTWPCGKDKDGDYVSYFGRGAKQLSYNYNYGPFSDAMYGDVRPLLDKPEMVADTWLNLASAIFFFVYPQPPKPGMLHVIDGTWVPNEHDKENGLVPGFGVTIQIINGGVECGGDAENAQSLNRIAYYKEFAKYLKVPVPADEVLGCKKMKQFDAGGAGALPIYWEMDWSWSTTTPDGQAYATRRRSARSKRGIMPNVCRITLT